MTLTSRASEVAPPEDVIWTRANYHGERPSQIYLSAPQNGFCCGGRVISGFHPSERRAENK